MAQDDGWNVVSTATMPKTADGDGWNVVSTSALRPAGLPEGVELGQPAAHPAVTMRGGAGNLETIPSADSERGVVGAVKTGVHNFGARVANNGAALLKPFVSPISAGKDILARGGFPLTPDAIKAASYNPSGPDAGATAENVLGDAATGLLSHGASTLASGIPGMARTAIAGDVNKPITGSNVTPLQRFNSAQNLGVNLDAADATNSGLLKNVKKLNEHSLLGSNSYEKLGSANTSALQGSTDNLLTRLYDGDRESGGAEIQKALKNNQQRLYGSATDGFESLPQNIPIPGLEDVGNTARVIARQNSAYQDLFPSLKPAKAMNVVGDVGGLGSTAPPPLKMSPFVDESGKSIPSSTQAPPRQPPSFGTGQQLRSDLLDFYRNNPDIVQNQGNGFIQRLAGQTDDALTNASSALTPDQLNTFRSANADWKDMKGTYDDPSSPFYHAVRSENPSSLYGGIGSKTPENARNVLSRLSPTGISPEQSPAVGALRRGTVEGALKSTSDGSPNLKTFGTQLNRIPADYRAELFSPDQNSTLRDIASTSNVLNKDFNPSGSAKLGQKVAEGAALFHPASMAAPLLQYPIAKLMTSPSAVRFLMSPAGVPRPLFPAPVSAATLGIKRKSIYGN